MDILLMILWIVTIPMMIISRWNGPAIIFDILLVLNFVSGVLYVYKSGKAE